MKDQFIQYKLAKALKYLGFDVPCFAKYQKLDSENANYQLKLASIMLNFNARDTSISAPLWQQAFDFFRKKHGLISCIHIDFSYEIYGGVHTEGYNNPYHIESEGFHSYEEARLACLEKLIEITKK